MNSIKMFLAVTLFVTAQNTTTFAQSPAPPSGAQKVNEYSDAKPFDDKCMSGNCVNGKGKMVYRTGDIYEGDFVDGKRVGQGTYTYKNGQLYVGQFSDGVRNGKGKFTFSDGSTYEGSFVMGNFIGHGTYTSKNVGNQTRKFTVGQIVDLQTKVLDTDFWGKAEIIEILGGKYTVRDLWSKTIEVVAEQRIRPFTAPVKYEIGQNVEVLDKGFWYKGEIIGNEVEYNDFYRIRFEGTTNRSDLSKNVRNIRPGVGTSTAQSKREIPASTNTSNSQGTQANASTTTQSRAPQSSSAMADILQKRRSAAVEAGHTILGSGVYDGYTIQNFEVKYGQTYILEAVSSSSFSIDLWAYGYVVGGDDDDLVYSDNILLTRTHDWNDSAYKIGPGMNHVMKSRVLTQSDHSMLQVNLGMTQYSPIKKIFLSPNKDKGQTIHWIFYKLK
ncbi:MAG: hypothetical protein ABL959_02415 [Pyrinomonadaceae bacterium]